MCKKHDQTIAITEEAKYVIPYSSQEHGLQSFKRTVSRQIQLQGYECQDLANLSYQNNWLGWSMYVQSVGDPIDHFCEFESVEAHAFPKRSEKKRKRKPHKKNLKRRETLQRYIRSSSDELDKLRRKLQEPTHNENS